MRFGTVESFTIALCDTLLAMERRQTVDRRGIAGVLLAHVALLLFFVAPTLWFSDRPLPNVDFETHANQTWRVLEGLRGWGASWVYDVQLLAGHPTGAIFDADNKGWELWTFALSWLGLRDANAFNSFALVVHLALVPTVYAAARLFDLSPAKSTLAAALAVALWWFDAWLHWCWWIGMIAYDGASYFALLPLALFYRFTEDRRPWQALCCALSLALCLLVHPYSFFILAPPMLVLWIRARRHLGLGGHAWVLAIGGLALLVNAYWLLVAGRFWHYILDSAIYGQSKLSILGADLLEWSIDPSVTGLIGSRTTIRWLVVALAILALASWRRRGDRRLLPLATAMAVLAGLAYCGGYFNFSGQIQPYRHVGPLALLAALPAADYLGELLASRPWQSWSRPTKVVFALMMIPLGQHLVHEVTYFTHAALPQPVQPRSRQHWWIGSSGFAGAPDYRILGPNPDTTALTEWVRAHDDGQGRFLVEVGHVGELLARATKAQIIGGFTQRNLAHAQANLYRRYPTGALSEAALREYLTTYAIRWIIVTPDAPWLRSYDELVQRVASFGSLVVYEVLSPAPLVMRGGGQVRASTNRIELRGSDPTAAVVLRFHWMETLVCRPECRIERVRIDADDPVGFIQIPAPHPADLEILNTYGEGP